MTKKRNHYISPYAIFHAFDISTLELRELYLRSLCIMLQTLIVIIIRNRLVLSQHHKFTCCDIKKDLEKCLPSSQLLSTHLDKSFVFKNSWLGQVSTYICFLKTFQNNMPFRTTIAQWITAQTLWAQTASYYQPSV